MRVNVILNGKRIAAPNYGDGVQWRRGPLLGKGGFGSVFLATPRDYYSRSSGHSQSSSSLISSLPAPCMAVKSAEISKSGSLKEEHQVLASLVGCPNIIQCFGQETTTGSDGSVAYNLLLEYASGGSLSKRIHNSRRDGGLAESEVRWYTRSILEGLKYIHEAGYVHCDLKPGNILLVPRRCIGSVEFMAKICDFGLAKRVTAGNHQEGCWRGTRIYCSPEALKRGEQETPSDIWSLGCMVLEMLTGKRAWDIMTEYQKEKDHDIDYEMTSSIMKKIPEELTWEATSFLMCCLITNPENRLNAKTLLDHRFVNVQGYIHID